MGTKSGPDGSSWIGFLNAVLEHTLADETQTELENREKLTYFRIDAGEKKRRRNDKKNGDEAEVNYINDRNKVFNKKLTRYFDKYTKEYVCLFSLFPHLLRCVHSGQLCELADDCLAGSEPTSSAERLCEILDGPLGSSWVDPGASEYPKHTTTSFHLYSARPISVISILSFPSLTFTSISSFFVTITNTYNTVLDVYVQRIIHFALTQSGALI